MRLTLLTAACLLGLSLAGCKRQESAPPPTAAKPATETSYATGRLADYVSVPLTADLSGMDAQDRRMLALLVQACAVMDSLY